MGLRDGSRNFLGVRLEWKGRQELFAAGTNESAYLWTKTAEFNEILMKLWNTGRFDGMQLRFLFHLQKTVLRGKFRNFYTANENICCWFGFLPKIPR